MIINKLLQQYKREEEKKNKGSGVKWVYIQMNESIQSSYYTTS